MKQSFLPTLCFLFLGGLCVFPQAQTVVEEDTITEVLDIGTLQESGKSKNWAMLGSAVLPGLGQTYLDESTRATFYFFTELLLWSGMFACRLQATQSLENAKAFAFTHAHVKPNVVGKGIEYYENVADFYDSWEYNEIYRLNREFDKLYPQNEDWSWRWNNRKNYATYDNLLRSYRTMRMMTTFFVGGLVVNRFVGLIDAARLTQRSRLKKTSPVSFRTTPTGLQLTARF